MHFFNAGWILAAYLHLLPGTGNEVNPRSTENLAIAQLFMTGRTARIGRKSCVLDFEVPVS